MTTAREAFEAKKLAQKYGVIGKVAARYRQAGYQVKVESIDPSAKRHFVATRKGEKLVVRVYSRSGTVPESVVEELASSGDGKKVLVLYGAGPKTSQALIDKAKQLGVGIKRVRA